MKKFEFKTSYKKILGDTYTPVGIYLKLRDKFPNSILLESSDYHGDEHSMSYICCDPVASFQVINNEIITTYPDGSGATVQIEQREQVIEALTNFSKSFATEELDIPCITDGVFGYSSYNAVRYFEDVEIDDFTESDREIPDMIYYVYRHVIAFNHFNNDLYIIDHQYGDQEEKIAEVQAFINKKDYATYDFNVVGEESSNFTDEEFLEILQKGIDHCQRGDVFQIVLSRRFQQEFEGDEFNVYRSLRSVNPSPYLFFFDFGKFKIFGSSPEAQIVVKDNKATIHPIAGTFKRTGNDSEDIRLSKKLFDDPKENSEHIMLVDLARNDLSRHGSQVTVESFKDIQLYSHVIHMVSKVTGQMDEGISSLQLFADTFPAGTLSGAPKPMAMKLINEYEHGCRGYYGGAIGYLGFDGEFNHAIMIRTILSKDKNLFYQAGAGVVVKSSIQSELQEVNHKLGALKKAIERASKVNN
ncbi:MAG: anthranilate synthase component I family protein [Cytophagales bacterium]|nr:anthranilate synthase component I family protein [Cytophagales bacterium]